MAPKNTPRKPDGDAPIEDQATTERNTRRAESSSRTRRDQRQVEYEKQQRQWFWTKIALVALAVVFIGFGGWKAWEWYERWQVTQDVDSYFGATDFVATHNDAEPILYEQIPPVGGYHRNAWQNCGFYSDYINNENGVHALEHGAVWITYDPNLPQEDIDFLESRAEEQFLLVSPYPGMDHPVVASVWGKQIKLDGVRDSRLDPFIQQYKKNVNNSPEPYGICWSGVSATTDTVPQQEPYMRPEGSDPVGGIPASFATATAEALNPQASTPETIGTPPVVATPGASPGSDPEGSPVGSGSDTITD
jgi:hypothetical protein